MYDNDLLPGLQRLKGQFQRVTDFFERDLSLRLWLTTTVQASNADRFATLKLGSRPDTLLIRRGFGITGVIGDWFSSALHAARGPLKGSMSVKAGGLSWIAGSMAIPRKPSQTPLEGTLA